MVLWRSEVQRHAQQHDHRRRMTYTPVAVTSSLYVLETLHFPSCYRLLLDLYKLQLTTLLRRGSDVVVELAEQSEGKIWGSNPTPSRGPL